MMLPSLMIESSSPGDAGTQSAVAGPGRPQYSYDGWSGVSRMENNEPPLLQSYSNPKKCKLTVEVGRLQTRQ